MSAKQTVNLKQIPDTAAPHLIQEGPAYQTLADNTGRPMIVVRENYRLQSCGHHTRYPVALDSLEAVPDWITASQQWMGGVAGEPPYDVWLFWTPEKLIFIPDTAPNPQMAPAVYRFKPTAEAVMWGAPKFSFKAGQKAFKDMIESAVALEAMGRVTLDRAADWLTVATHMKLIQKVSREAVIEDRQNITVAYSEASQTGSVKVPKTLTITLPLFEGAPEPVKITYQVEFDWSDGLVFILRCLVAESLVLESTRQAVDWIKAQVAEADKTLTLRTFHGTPRE